MRPVNLKGVSRGARRVVAALALGVFAGTGSVAVAAENGAMDGMDDGMSNMDMNAAEDVPRFPPVAGFAADEQIFFAHTEASDPEIARTLTEMMGSPVPVVPALGDVPDNVLAHVYVFQNGVKPDGPRGPMGYQPDVFDNLPGTEGYTPLRRVMLVSWGRTDDARVVKSAKALSAAGEDGELTVESTDIVVNMPFLTWPAGER